MADVESKSIPHELPSSHWLKATGQCVLERYLSATMESYLFMHLLQLLLLTSSPKGNDRSPENKQVFSNSSQLC